MVLYIGISGTLLSGKGTLENIILDNYNAYSSSTSEIARKATKKRLGREDILRQDIVETANALRKKKGPGILAEMALNHIATLDKKYDVIIIDGLRNPGEVKILRGLLGGYFSLIFVDAPRKLRYKRSVARGREGAASQTFEEFEAEDEKEMRSDNPWEINFEQCKMRANKSIENTGTVEELKKEVMTYIDSMIEETNLKGERDKKYGYAKSFMRKDSEKESGVTETQAE